MDCTVSVRTLCEFTARQGDLDLRFTPAPTALQGMEGHGLVRSRRGPEYEAEISLQGVYQTLQVRGRADGYDPVAQQLEEIKTYRGELGAIRANHRALHWAQAKIYGHLLCAQRALPRLKIALVYFHIGTHKEDVLVETLDAADLQGFFDTQCARFLDWARSEDAHRRARDQALAALAFPLGTFRAGQRELSVAVYRTARAPAGGSCLLAQAPTGIGKTMGTLFPMLKACPDQGLDKIFFLTAKGTGHGLATQALGQINQQLQATDAAPLRALTLQARDKSCEHRDKACHGDSCPLARGFYDRLPQARAAMLNVKTVWDSARLREIALAHAVCPYYLTQEMARWSDVVIGDYNYFYDGAAMLHALTQAHQWKVGILVDEAHNLVDRARSMYTAELTQPALAAARKHAKTRIRKSLDNLNRAWNALHEGQEAPYQCHAQVPLDFMAALQKALSLIAEANADNPMLPGDPVLGFYLAALQFSVLEEKLDEHALFDVTLTAPQGRKRPTSTLCIRNVIPAPHLQARHAAAHATVLFSGTLGPAAFYRDTLGLPEDTPWIDVPAPFKAQQLAVHIVRDVSTRYHDREASVARIVQLVSAQFRRRPGNYLCFFSSFDYLERVADALCAQDGTLPVWRQVRAMGDDSRQAYIERFREGGQGIGFAVLGGAFGEGIDLPGDRLIGAFIATLGLPQVNPVNESMKRCMQQRFGHRKGYDYTYLFPGLRKVVQAAGRVIRSEQDTGTLFLMDDRFAREEVASLMPAWWR
ncbi:ATP-dependent DNA helicase [Acidovorax sp. Be4]|uniref:ATP-dependent DNA helicase n=1 Tax=Acidovorax bellezanensis TaxID=2976702 RepID=A0ABT2PHQ2_9BURK|nr:ATP-dependent DNA helicase [Acidovorax sp. Be4]MCT9809982.1 ATP-dependent DNA helicase [Acidovorax sp. Be4]